MQSLTLATTSYFDGAIAESTAFYSSTLEIPESIGRLPLIVLSHGLSDGTNGIADAQQSQFEQEWTRMQKELAGLSSNGKQVVAAESGHYIQLEQPHLVIEAIADVIEAKPNAWVPRFRWRTRGRDGKETARAMVPGGSNH